MEPIKMSVSVDVNVDLSQATKDFLVALFSSRIAPCGCTITESPIEKELNQVAEAEAEAIDSVEKEVAKTEAEPVVEPAKPEKEAAKKVTIEDVRAALASKVNDHREAIKAKLDELGAPSVTKLDPSKYEEMYNFLNSL